MKQLPAIGLVTIGMLGAACTDGSPRLRDAPPTAGADAPSSRDAGQRLRGPPAGHAHRHAERTRAR